MLLEIKLSIKCTNSYRAKAHPKILHIYTRKFFFFKLFFNIKKIK